MNMVARIASVMVMASALSGCGCSSYGFGLAEREHPSLFGPAGPWGNRVIKYNEEYSWFTMLQAGSEVIGIEHGTIASREDIARVGLEDGDYLFFSIEIRSGAVTSIHATHSYDGEELKPAGTYMYRSHRLADGNLDPSRPNWEVIPITGDDIHEKAGFGYVRFYHLPSSYEASRFLPKRFWFGGELREKITIGTVADGESAIYPFEFGAYWHRKSTTWWEMISR